MKYIKKLSIKIKINILITLLLIFQIWYINYNTVPKEIQPNLLLLSNREKYITNLEKKFEELKKSGLYNKLKTDILLKKDTKIDVIFIKSNDNKEKYKSELKKPKVIGDNIFIDLYYYHKNYINKLFHYTKNIMIMESFFSMLDTIKKIQVQYPDIFSKKDIETIRKIKDTMFKYIKEMKVSENEIKKFDKKIEKLYGIEPYKYKVNHLDLKGEIKKFDLLLEMFHNTNNLFINIPKNKSDDPFIKFNTFINIYDKTYNIYKSLIQKYNKKVEEENKFNKFILSIISISIIILSFLKEKIEE